MYRYQINRAFSIKKWHNAPLHGNQKDSYSTIIPKAVHVKGIGKIDFLICDMKVDSITIEHKHSNLNLVVFVQWLKCLASEKIESISMSAALGINVLVEAFSQEEVKYLQKGDILLPPMPGTDVAHVIIN